MRVLGIETTCDETACSIVIDGRHILSNIIFSQADLHAQFGGVVPELACRRHIEVITSVIEQACSHAQCSIRDIDLIAVSKGPGLIGALLVGIDFAKGLSIALDKPLIGVNHVEAHLYASMITLSNRDAYFPALGLIVSGGHTAIVLMETATEFYLVGETIDDAIGEAFDKVAKLLGLPYPGGPEIEKLAKQGNSERFPFKAGHVKEDPLAFSFSGLKTKVLYTIQSLKECSMQDKADIAATFQKTAIFDVVEKLKKTIALYNPKALFFGGGVTNNRYLQSAIQEHFATVPQFWPESSLTMDNAAMIAAMGYELYTKNPENEVLSLLPKTRIPFRKKNI